MTVDMSPKAVTVRLQRLSQLRNLCLSLAAAGRRAGLAAPEAEPPAAPQRDDLTAVPPDQRIIEKTGRSGGPISTH